MIAAAFLVVLGIALWPRRAVGQRGPHASPAREAGGRHVRPRWRSSASRREEHRRQLVAVLDALAAALAVGMPPAAALDVLIASQPSDGRWRSDLERVARAARSGGSMATAWREVASRQGWPELQVLAAAHALSERHGAPLASSIATTARVIRAAGRAQARARAATAGAQATALLLTVLPVGGIGLGLMMGVDVAAVYSSPLGLGCLALGALLAAIGQVTVSRMAASAVRGTPI